MRELSKEECADVSGGGSFSRLINFGLGAPGAVLGLVIGGAAGSAIAFGLTYGLTEGAGAIYDASNKDRENKRVENYEY